MKTTRIKYYFALLLSWTILIVSLISFELFRIKKETDNLAKTEARANFNKDVAVRLWVSSHGGVYVPVDSITQPNPALSHIPERDIETLAGEKLTLMNPAYVMRQLNEYFAEYYGVVGHITSKKLLRSENKPDKWELNALNQFEKGLKEVGGYSDINGEPYLRLMQPLITKQSCLKCHGHQDYKVGDIRGGIGISIPMKPILERASLQKKQHISAFSLLWFIGFIGLSMGFRRLDNSLRKQERAKKILKAQNKEYVSLNKKYKIQNEELIKAKEKAEESDRLKTEFLNNMSHEIRTPMNAIQGFSNFLNESDLTNEKRNFYINIIQNSGNQLLRIVDDILEISELETKQVRVSENEVCLNDFLLELFSIFDIKAKESKIPLYLKKGLSDKDSAIITDKTKLNKILSNLLENALKFTNEGFIEFGYTVVNNEIEIYVKDTGIGIKTDKQEIIFERFSQENENTATNYGGLGLGLSITKENTGLLGGKIWVKSEKGKGSTFFVTIPYKPAYSNTEITSQSTIVNQKSSVEKYTILIVEDEEFSYLYLETLFEKLDLNSTILLVKNGKEAVEMCKTNSKIDFVLMDLKMPIMNGYVTTKQIKEFRPELPIVAQTAYSTTADKNKAISAGCDDFISKPISKEALISMIDKYLITKQTS